MSFFLILYFDWVVIDHRDFFLSCLLFLLSILMPFVLPSCVSLSYFILAVSMRECLGKTHA